MSYHHLGKLPSMTSTQLFAESVDPYSWRNFQPGIAYGPYGWGPGMNIGMPFNYTHHMGYQRVPLRPGTYDRLGPGMHGSWSGSQPGYAAEAPGGALAGVLAVL